MKTISLSLMILLFCIGCAGASPQPLQATEDLVKTLPTKQETQPKEALVEVEPAQPPADEDASNPYEIFKDTREIPGDEIGKRVRETIAAINANDPEKISAFAKEAFTEEFFKAAAIDEHVSYFLSLYHETKGVEFYSTRTYEGNLPQGENIFILTSKTTLQWLAITIYVEPEPPHRIERLRLGPARAPHEAPKLKDLSQKEIVTQLKRYVTKLAQADIFSGSVLLAKDGNVLFKKAYGKASKRFDVPNKIDTKYNLASMNKMFTSVAIAQLVEQSKLSFDDPLSKYISEDWMPVSVTDKIQIKHLLTHTSGLGNYFSGVFQTSSRLLFRNLDDYKPLVKTEELPFEPGTRFQYSNTGMFMLGVVIEKVTGKSYFDYIREHIYKPAGMINTDSYEMDRPVPNLAIGYTRSTDGLKNNYYNLPLKGAAAGGGFSTVEDLLAFDVALRSNRLLNAELTELIMSAKPELESPYYGYGFGIAGESTDRIVGHGGGFTGIQANLDMFLDSGYTAVVMSNYDVGASAVISKINELITARKK